ncbi:hypothetical protein AVEN_227325-1 [Araneus ventricosus]|uniref:Uncharacterized protein n=1 Tax=Araneus ventricosus TaxID=182803 RepID=A0A4Y2GV56_ARAVE|nr:hypothetical protein AVEN_227325-1 [Araneus ventricosus]
MHRPKLVKQFGAISSRPLANAKRWCIPTYQAVSRKMSPQQCERRRAMFGRCLADDVLLHGYGLVFEVKRGYFGTDVVVLSRGRMTRTTPEIASPLQTSAPHQRGGRLDSIRNDLTCDGC